MLRDKNIIWIMMLLACTSAHAQSTERKYLSGRGKDDMVSWDFFCTAGRNAGKWTSIGVPSCWELQGFGKYDYGFAKDSLRGKEKGLYRYRFAIPASWKNKTVRIVFEGSMTDTEVKINGKPAGVVHQGSFYAFRYDISGLIHAGNNNLLEVTVAKHSANPSVNAAERKADFWLFGGIFRPVYLEALPRDHIEQVAIDAAASGKFTAILHCHAMPDSASVMLYTATGQLFGSISHAGNGNTSDSVYTLEKEFASPALWSPENPQRYRALFTIYKAGMALHQVAQWFGFRTVEVKQRDGIYVNGVKVKMKGVNRHSFWPTSGRTTSAAISINDVLMMKDMNMNAVRMSHYPPDDHFLDACDSLGLFVMDELAGWHGHYDTPTGTKLLKEMLDHDRNHPSIIFWNNGNEGGHNLELDHLFTEQDMQHRPVVHPWQLFGGIETQHYREYNYGIGNYESGHEIIMPTEFLHGLYDGGHGAGLEDYWESMWHNPQSAGGFLWDFADEGVVRRDRHDSIDTDGNHGADGIVGPYHEKEGSYFAIKEIWSPVHVEKTHITHAFDGRIQLENRYFYTNLRQCRFEWELKKWKDSSALNGKAASPDIAPGAKGILSISLPDGWQQYDVLYMKAWDPFNRELFTWSFPITLPAGIAQQLLRKNGDAAVELSTTDSLYIVKAANVTYRFRRRDGLLEAVNSGGEETGFRNGPIVHEGATNFGNFSAVANADSVVIASAFDRKDHYNSLRWTVYKSGWLKMDMHYFPGAYFTNFDGAGFSFPENKIKAVQYLGQGPYRVWKNRMTGNRLGVWNKIYNSTETGESWNYPEFKGYHANVYWCRFLTTGKTWLMATETEDMFLRLFTPAWKTDPWHNYEPLFPEGDISFLQGIPSIGTKTQRNETTGPMGMKNIFYDYEKDPGRSLKMVLYFNFNEQ